jgi:hypothetical protein
MNQTEREVVRGYGPDYEAMYEEVERLVDRVRHHFVGVDPKVIGPAVAILSSKFIAGHHPESRGDVLVAHLKLIADLAPIYARELGGAEWESKH